MRGLLVVFLAIAPMLLAACGGGTRSTTADMLAMHQPTPDPTLDAVVKDLPRALAGVPPTATPTPVVVALPNKQPKTPTPVPAPKPAAPRQPSPTAPTTHR